MLKIKREPEVRIIFDGVKEAEMGEDVEGWEDEIYEYASSSPKELDELIKIFNEEKDLDDKLLLSEILVKLKCKKIIPELKKILDCSDREHQIWAAGHLIAFEDEKGVEVIKKVAKKANKYELDFISEVLCDADNRLSVKLILELADEYEEINKGILRSSLENKLSQYEKEKKIRK
jgi:hypothetical protein